MENLRCISDLLDKERFNADGIKTASSDAQIEAEESIAKSYRAFSNRLEIEKELYNLPVLQRDIHVPFLLKGLKQLTQSYECLDASRPWLCYWILHSLDLLDVPIDNDTSSEVAKFLGKCQSPTGGFGGGPGQYAHLAPTYAAVNALCILGTEEAYAVIDRKTLQTFLLRMKTPDGAFKMHSGGEVDIRGAYCVASCARLTNITTPSMFEGTAEWIVSCQTYEGGFGGCPDLEAHGGYSFCGLAALTLLGRAKLCNMDNLIKWTVNKQMRYEGGFQGRTNKLVDGCYSFWQGGTFPLIHMVLAMQNTDVSSLSAEHWLFHQEALQEYLLICCQHQGGGLVDKPGKARDYYHTCYCLSGMSVAQHFAGGKLSHCYVVGHPDNELKATHPVYNIGVNSVVHANMHFSKLPVPVDSSSQPASTEI